MARRIPSGQITKKAITRADVRSATIHGLKTTKANPQHVKLSPGQRAHITRATPGSTRRGRSTA